MFLVNQKEELIFLLKMGSLIEEVILVLIKILVFLIIMILNKKAREGKNIFDLNKNDKNKY